MTTELCPVCGAYWQCDCVPLEAGKTVVLYSEGSVYSLPPSAAVEADQWLPDIVENRSPYNRILAHDIGDSP